MLDGQHQNDSDSLDSVSNNKKWLSEEENLASCVDGEDNENLFVALYDFESGAENQLDLVKGILKPDDCIQISPCVGNAKKKS